MVDGLLASGQEPIVQRLLAEPSGGSAGLLSNHPPAPPNVFERAVQQFPIISKFGVKGILNPNGGQGYMEFWPPGETGTPDQPRPEMFGNAPGVEIYRTDTRPIDVLGDVVSHYLVQKDPKIASYYQQFQASITPLQRKVLHEQYQWAQKNEGEARPYEVWRETSGLPALFRGYAFQQWPKEFTDKVYTEDQRKMFDQMMGYLGGGGG